MVSSDEKKINNCEQLNVDVVIFPLLVSSSNIISILLPLLIRFVDIMTGTLGDSDDEIGDDFR